MARLGVAATIAGLVFFLFSHVRPPWGSSSASPGHRELPAGDPANPWESITPSSELEWHPCYGHVNPSFQCARLTVPLDYNDPLSQTCGSPKVHIALTLLPANKATSAARPHPRSPMLINPGGPGGSGVMAALGMASALQAIFGDDQPIIGFDPRGIGATTPVADCWAPPPACDGCPEDVGRGLMHRVEWANMNQAYGGINSSNIALQFINAGHRAINNLCVEKDGTLGGKSILGHATTAHVARDMVSIVDAWERWVDGQDKSESHTELNPTKGRLVYWGFSYGTYLGATFASMFPDRVGRLLLDGVVDAEHYAAPVWRDSLYDTDKILGRFFQYCAEAGFECQLYRAGDKPADLGQRYRSIMDGLTTNPATFTHPEYFFPVLIQPHMIEQLVFGVLYSPIASFPVLAMLLNLMHEKKYEALGALVQDAKIMCLVGDSPSASLLNDAQRAIMCGDKTSPVNLTLAEIRSEHAAMAETSQFADVMINVMLQCNGWSVLPPHRSPPTPWARYTAENQIATAFPILFLSNTLDPVTPLVAAVKMSLKFRRAGLVEQKAEGHCTVSAVSRCTARAVRNYVLRGEVPPAPEVDGGDYLGGSWTTCEADERPWKRLEADVFAFEDDDERRVVEAFQAVQSVVERLPQWGQGPPTFEGLRALRE
ncbi:TAP-like protein-domain-containing protein [Lasiosphaeris hirsuta]|uniref:TAP-like protein-domain-containing protein n=1 Tax=Lasiosphaeris hirsuta TaxID=260670 RepID=A0AA40DLZ9_9PEZI|nr:TAP-like protein-domain-containing protein [Lasiosphaeris hirsuta]